MPKNTRRIVRRRVVSERVIGSSNPVARWGRESKSTCMDSIGGFFFGLLLFFITFSLPYCAAKTEKVSQDVAQWEVISAIAAAGYTGPALIEGTVEAASEIIPPIIDVDKPILAYHYIAERFETRYETHEETHTETRGGQDVEVVEEVTEEVQEWVTVDEDRSWAEVKLGGIRIDPAKCQMELPWVSKFHDTYASPSGEDMREEVSVVYAGAKVLLAAELESGQVKPQSKPYRLTTGSKDELVGQMHSEEESQRWFFLIASVILWVIAFNLMVGPAMIIFNIFPIKAIGTAIRVVIGVIALIMAIITTAVTYVVIAYWWVIALLMVVLAVAVVVTANRSRKAEPDLDVDEIDEPPEPVESS